MSSVLGIWSQLCLLAMGIQRLKDRNNGWLLHYLSAASCVVTFSSTMANMISFGTRCFKKQQERVGSRVHMGRCASGERIVDPT